jgi:hypothetical protein
VLVEEMAAATAVLVMESSAEAATMFMVVDTTAIDDDGRTAKDTAMGRHANNARIIIAGACRSSVVA